MNRGLPIDVEHMQDEIEKEMMLYRQQMKEISSEYDNALEAHTASLYEYNRSKRIYCKLAKVLHPDIFPDIRNQPDLQQLWAEIVAAYNRCDVERLEDYEVIVRIKLDAWGEDGFALACTDLDWRINRVEMQINEILTTEPYTYCELLHDDAKKAAHREALQAEHDEYEAHLAELKKTLEELLHQEGTKFLWNLT